MLPKAVRARKHLEVGAFIEQRAGERRDEVVALLAEHYSRAATLGEEVRLDRMSWRGYAARRCSSSRPPATPRARCTPTRRHWLTMISPPRSAQAITPSRRASARSRATSRCDWGASTPRSRCGSRDSSTTAIRTDLEHVAELHRKIGAALAHKGERTQAIQHHQQGINLIKDAPPSLALVRLYEEAAWLYMQVGDNMLAIYASEKALRLAERLSEVRAASRAHGIFDGCSAASATRRRPARTSSERSSSPRTPTRTRPCSRCWRLATTSRTPRATTLPPSAHTPRRWRWRSASATSPRR